MTLESESELPQMTLSPVSRKTTVVEEKFEPRSTIHVEIVICGTNFTLDVEDVTDEEFESIQDLVLHAFKIKDETQFRLFVAEHQALAIMSESMLEIYRATSPIPSTTEEEIMSNQNTENTETTNNSTATETKQEEQMKTQKPDVEQEAKEEKTESKDSSSTAECPAASQKWSTKKKITVAALTAVSVVALGYGIWKRMK